MQPHAGEEYRQQMGHIWQGFEETQMRDWLSNAGFSAIRVHAPPVDETSRGPALFVASGTKI
jgi:ArsR family transcriptional regulator